jgi:hypothetical protein
MRLIVILLLGKVGLRHMKYTYLLGNILDLNIAVPSVVYSNAVLEHIPPKMLNSLFKDLQAIGCESLIGIIDTNDHINRGLTPADQFKDFDGTDEEVQLRGNGLTHSQWKNIFQNVCSEGKIEQLTVNSSVVPGILVFDFRFESIN